MEAIDQLTDPEGFDKLIETRWETFEEQVAATLAEGLAMERRHPGGGADRRRARLRDVGVAPARDDSGDWIEELHPADQIAGLPDVVREELVGGRVVGQFEFVGS